MLIVNFLITIILLILILGILVFVHELGHFLAAKLMHVEVEEFAFGFGKNLISKKYKDTIYKINLLFLGGYVKLLGDDDPSSFSQVQKKEYSKSDIEKFTAELKKLCEKDIKSLIGKIDCVKNSKLSEEKKKELLSFIYTYLVPNNKDFISNKSFLARFFILVAGVVMNIFLAVLIFTIFLSVSNFKTSLSYISEYKFLGAETSVYNIPIINVVYNQDLKNVFYSNLEDDDRPAIAILEINEQKFTDIDNFKSFWNDIKNEEILLTYMYIDEPTQHQTNMILNTDGFDTNIDPELENKIVFTAINEDMPASNAGLKPKDILLKIDDEDIEFDTAEDFVQFLDENQAKTMKFTVLREDGNIYNLNVELNKKSDKDDLILGASFGLNEVFAVQQYELDYSNNKLFAGFYHSINMLGYNVVALGNIFWLSIKTKDPALATNSISSIWGVGEHLNTLVIAKDYKDILNLSGLISVALAFMNILPIPLLDGGQIMFLILEKIRGKELNRSTQEKISKITFFSLIIFSILIIVKDIWIGFIGEFIRKIL